MKSDFIEQPNYVQWIQIFYKSGNLIVMQLAHSEPLD